MENMKPGNDYSEQDRFIALAHYGLRSKCATGYRNKAAWDVGQAVPGDSVEKGSKVHHREFTTKQCVSYVLMFLKTLGGVTL